MMIGLQRRSSAARRPLAATVRGVQPVARFVMSVRRTDEPARWSGQPEAYGLSAVNPLNDKRSLQSRRVVNVVKSAGNVASWRHGRSRGDASLPRLVRRCLPSVLVPPSRCRAESADLADPSDRWRRARPPASIRSCSPAPRPRSTSTRSRRATRSASSTSPSRRASRASTSSTCAAARSKATASPTAAAPTPTTRASSSASRTISAATPVERHLHHRRLLPGQVRAFDEGPRPRLVEQQRRAARHRHPQRLVCRGRHDPASTASSAARKAASRSAAKSQ